MCLFHVTSKDAYSQPTTGFCRIFENVHLASNRVASYWLSLYAKTCNFLSSLLSGLKSWFEEGAENKLKVLENMFQVLQTKKSLHISGKSQKKQK